MKRYLFAAVSGLGVIERWIEDADRKFAYLAFWNGLTDEQRDATESVECIDEEDA